IRDDLVTGVQTCALPILLLLEAGPDHRTADAPTGLRASNFFNAMMEPGRIWPNLVATRVAGQPAAVYVRGRGAGGSSSINAMGEIGRASWRDRGEVTGRG